MGPDAVLVAAKFGLLSGNAVTTLDLDALKLSVAGPSLLTEPI
jgi:hypothetical protein